MSNGIRFSKRVDERWAGRADTASARLLVLARLRGDGIKTGEGAPDEK